VGSALAWWLAFATSPLGRGVGMYLATWWLLFVAFRLFPGLACRLRGRHDLTELTTVGVLFPGFRPHSIVVCRRCRRRWHGRGADLARALRTGTP